MTVKEGSMHAQEVYLHPYCLVVTRSDQIHIPALGAGLLTTARGVPIIAWAAEHAGGFYYNYRDGNGDFILNVCVCVAC